MTTINEKVAEKIAGISPAVEAKVVDLLVDKELNRRTELVVQGLTRQEEIQKELRKLSKPDFEAYDEAGALTSTGYTKARKEQRDKLVERDGKLVKAIEKALAGDTSDLANLVQQKGGGDKAASEAE